MKEKVLNITIGALIGAVVVSLGFLISTKLNKKIRRINGMPQIGQKQMRSFNGQNGEPLNGGSSNGGSQSGPGGQNERPSNSGNQSGTMNKNEGTPPQMLNGGNLKIANKIIVKKRYSESESYIFFYA